MNEMFIPARKQIKIDKLITEHKIDKLEVIYEKEEDFPISKFKDLYEPEEF